MSACVAMGPTLPRDGEYRSLDETKPSRFTRSELESADARRSDGHAMLVGLEVLDADDGVDRVSGLPVEQHQVEPEAHAVHREVGQSIAPPEDKQEAFLRSWRRPSAESLARRLTAYRFNVQGGAPRGQELEGLTHEGDHTPLANGWSSSARTETLTARELVGRFPLLPREPWA